MPKNTYPIYKRHCGWACSDNIKINSSRLQNLQSCDAIIVGAGYTGLAIAQRLAELCPQDDIRVIDAEQIGMGSAGRNSGFLLENAFAAKDSISAQVLYQHYRKNHREIVQRAKLPALDSGSSKIFKGAATERGINGLKSLAKHLEDSGQPFEWFQQDDLESITGSSYYRSGILLPENRLLNPYSLVRLLAHQLPSNVTLHEQCPALSVEEHQSKWQVSTPNGVLQAPKVYLANNAFAKHLGYGQGHSVTIYTYAGITEPLDSRERQSVMAKGQWGLLPAHRLGSTFRTTDDGRLLVRGMYGYEKEGDQKVEAILQHSLQKRFPNIKTAQSLSDWWGGTTALTSNGAPLWGELKPGLYASIGCNGVGIVKGWMLGQELALLSCKKSTLNIPELFGKPSWMPPEPFRQLGFLAVSEIEKSMAGTEK